MLIAVLRHSAAFIFLFFTLDMAFLMLSLSVYYGNTTLQKAGGGFGGHFILHNTEQHSYSRDLGLLAAFAAWYCALAQLLNKDNSYFTLPTVPFQKKAD